METKILEPTNDAINEAADLMKRGEIIAFPTETVYGLGASIFDEQAIKKIYDVKGRPSDNPLIAHISSLTQIELIAQNIPKLFYDLADNFFPGPLTLVVSKKERVPDIASAGLPTIGIRMPDHPVAWKLIEAIGSPIVAPSANLSGKPSPTSAYHVFEDLQGKIPLIIDGGQCDVGIESTVLDLTTTPPVILRPGHVSKEQLEKILQQPILISTKIRSDELAKAPGMKYRHYAPEATIYDVSTLGEFYDIIKKIDVHNTMVLTNVHLPTTYDFNVVLPLTEKTLYASFRRADKEEIPDIIIFLDDETKKNTGLYNRIEKAVEK